MYLQFSKKERKTASKGFIYSLEFSFNFLPFCSYLWVLLQILQHFYNLAFYLFICLFVCYIVVVAVMLSLHKNESNPKVKQKIFLFHIFLYSDLKNVFYILSPFPLACHLINLARLQEQLLKCCCVLYFNSLGLTI